MPAQLRSYFESETQQRRALDALFSPWGGFWEVSKSLELYEASQCAFDPSSNADEAFRSFEKIYAELARSHWNVFRSPQAGAARWTPRQVFDAIDGGFEEFSWRGPVNLLNFPKSEAGPRLEACLAKMRGIKQKKDYPLMTVSKFLHFYNPALFPIYDTAVIWNKVFSRFKNDFREFCEREEMQNAYRCAMKEDTVTFLGDYMRWASSLLSVAHGSYMQVFIDWLAKEPGTELSKRGFDVTTLHATAFEFTAIGATAAS
jgi:hypothetical protein